MVNEFDLTRPCDACGKPVYGGFHFCPKCNICLCELCIITLIYAELKFPIKCPMCNKDFPL